MSLLARAMRSADQFIRWKLGWEIRKFRPPGQELFPPYVADQFVSLRRKYHEYTMVPWQGLHAAYLAARYVAQRQIAGAIVECGVYKGGCSMLLAETAESFGKEDLDCWLYDTFAGMAEPTEHDYKGDRAEVYNSAKLAYERAKKDGFVDWCYSPLTEVKHLANSTGIAPDKFHFVVGKVEDTIPAQVPEEISVLRLDTDFYESTRHELIHLYPRLNTGGVLIIDDYGSWTGARKAVDEFFSSRDDRPLLLPDMNGALVGVKC